MAVETLRNGKKAAILEALRNGNTRRAAAEAVGIHHSTFYAWIAADPTLSDAVEKAEAEAEQFFLSHVKAAAPENWTAAAWYLERRRRTDYGRNEKLTIIQQTAKELAGLDDAALAAIAYGDDTEAAGAVGATAPGDSSTGD